MPEQYVPKFKPNAADIAVVSLTEGLMTINYADGFRCRISYSAGMQPGRVYLRHLHELWREDFLELVAWTVVVSGYYLGFHLTRQEMNTTNDGFTVIGSRYGIQTANAKGWLGFNRFKLATSFSTAKKLHSQGRDSEIRWEPPRHELGEYIAVPSDTQATANDLFRRRALEPRSKFSLELNKERFVMLNYNFPPKYLLVR